MAKLTVADLQQMKRDGKKIAAAVVHDFQMAKICEMAGADILSVGDSVGQRFLAVPNSEDFTVADMIPFGKAVVRASERAVVSVDMPPDTCKGGATEIAKAARRIKDEVGAAMTKKDVRGREDSAFEDIRAVVESGLFGISHESTFKQTRPRRIVGGGICRSHRERHHSVAARRKPIGLCLLLAS